ncbi:hypothetical protein GF352_03475 [archaeon]|nr:hypothetical protein [archaeon]
MKLLTTADTPLEEAISRMKNKDFKKIIRKIEKAYGKKNLDELRIKTKFEVRLKNGKETEEGIKLIEKYK